MMVVSSVPRKGVILAVKWVVSVVAMMVAQWAAVAVMHLVETMEARKGRSRVGLKARLMVSRLVEMKVLSSAWKLVVDSVGCWDELEVPWWVACSVSHLAAWSDL